VRSATVIVNVLKMMNAPRGPREREQRGLEEAADLVVDVRRGLLGRRIPRSDLHALRHDGPDPPHEPLRRDAFVGGDVDRCHLALAVEPRLEVLEPRRHDVRPAHVRAPELIGADDRDGHDAAVRRDPDAVPGAKVVFLRGGTDQRDFAGALG
jgi:hypothetical protein